MYTRVSGFLIVTMTLCASLGAQTARKDERQKEFGHSLKKFDRKAEQISDRKPLSDDLETIRVETNLIFSDALVIDKSGNVVAGLQKTDFVVTEDEKPQKIELFSFGNDERAPKSIVMIIEAGGTPSIFNRNIRAANQLIYRLGPIDRMAIVSDNVELLSGFTSDKKVLTKTLERLKNSPRPSRREYSTLIAVLNEIVAGDEIRPIVVLQGSGDEMLMTKPIWPTTLSICRRGFKDYCERSFSFQDVLSVVERSRATIYGVVPNPKIVGVSAEEQKRKAGIILDGLSQEIHDRQGEPERAKFRRVWEDLTIRETAAMQQSMIEVTRLSGGFTTFIESADKVDELYSSLFATMENRYSIGYYSEPGAKSTARKIRIAIKNHPEYTVVARKSYVPASAK